MHAGFSGLRYGSADELAEMFMDGPDHEPVVVVEGEASMSARRRETLGPVSGIDEMAILVGRDLCPLEQNHMAS
jgi:hypothetical protein